MNAEQRKSLRDSYKNKPSVGAIYAIDCSGDHSRMVKSTVDIGGIRNRYAFALKIGSCPDPAVTEQWRAYGPQSLSLVVLEELTMKEGQTAREFAEDVRQLYKLWLEGQSDRV